MEYIEQDDKDIFWAENKVNSLKKLKLHKVGSRATVELKCKPVREWYIENSLMF